MIAKQPLQATNAHYTDADDKYNFQFDDNLSS